MKIPTGWTAIVFLLCLWPAEAADDDWTRPVEVTFDQKRCISFRAALIGEYLAVEAAIEPGWHTFGLEAGGPWLQSPPRDFSRPELRWFSWGFVDRALFAVTVRRSGKGPGQITVRGQICTETTCKRIDVVIVVPFPPPGSKSAIASPDFKDLIRVRRD
jgi:hypothetical protein